MAIAKQLDALGVHRIEAGMPAVSAQDKAAISDIAALGLKAEVLAFARCIPEEIKVVKACGCKGVVVEIPASDHMIKNAYGWTVDRAMKSSIDTTLAAKEAGLYTVFFTIDATRTELNRFLDIVDQVATEGHMDALTMADTVGGCSPEAISYAVKKVIDRLKKPVEIHGHQDFGLGVANTIAALAAGASVAHTTVTGLGERAGNVPMEDVVMSLLCLYGIDLGIRTEKFCEVSRFVMDLARVTQAPNRPIVGEKLYKVESGIIAGWIRMARKDNPLEFVPFAAGPGRTEAGQHRPRQEQRPAVDGRVVREAGRHGHRRRADGDAQAGEGEVVREKGSADGGRVQGDRRARAAKGAGLNVEAGLRTSDVATAWRRRRRP